MASSLRARLPLLAAALAAVALYYFFGAAANFSLKARRVREARAAVRARRAVVAAAAGAEAPQPWSPPALDANLAKCLRDNVPRWRAHLETEFGMRLGYLGGTFCNQCDREWLESWSRICHEDATLCPKVVLDIGGNVGNYGAKFLEAFPAPTVVHSFELDPGTFGVLSARRAAHPDRARWTLTNNGVAQEAGSKQFYSGGAGSGLSSLGPLDADNKLVLSQAQNITTVPAIMERLGLDFVDFAKIDVEGWEREVILGMLLDGAGAGSVGAFSFETGETWRDSRKGPSNLLLSELVDYLSGVPPYGYACFYIGREDFLPISAPALAPIDEVDQNYGLNVLCLRRDTRLHAALLGAHRRKLDHCLAGQGLWGYLS